MHDAVLVLADQAVVAYLGVRDVRVSGEVDLVAGVVGARADPEPVAQADVCSCRHQMSMRSVVVRVAVQRRQAGRTALGLPATVRPFNAIA